MKKLLLAAIAFLFVLPPFGQQQQPPPLPTDPTIKIGKLENGMTYFIRHNDKPAKRCEFYLATNVGAFQEEDDQDGLAHFLEHMCFNGTKNFPGKGILNYLRSIGAEFGSNINAATGLEQTTYMLNNIPLETAGGRLLPPYYARLLTLRDLRPEGNRCRTRCYPRRKAYSQQRRLA